METVQSYVYFEITGEDFDPQIISKKLGIKPSRAWRMGEARKKGAGRGEYNHSSWASPLKNGVLIDELVEEIVTLFKDKVEAINQVKNELKLKSVLVIVMYVDTNPESSTPVISHQKEVIDFLYHTGTTTDVDIYRFDSRE